MVRENTRDASARLDKRERHTEIETGGKEREPARAHSKVLRTNDNVNFFTRLMRGCKNCQGICHKERGKTMVKDSGEK